MLNSAGPKKRKTEKKREKTEKKGVGWDRGSMASIFWRPPTLETLLAGKTPDFSVFGFFFACRMDHCFAGNNAKTHPKTHHTRGLAV